ncbi:MAG: N-acetylgalactosamine 6-sulfate sulfatase, partial [Lentisphaerae bacterium]|nr:N-acetylgalactosamine 6-sulfate sulfatase [Lentisphaerota bacterium]
MKRREFMKVAGLGAVALGLRPDMGVAAEEEKAGRPNIILMMTDDQGWSDVSYNEKGALAKGAFKTPELDAMAAAGLRFDRFYAAAPVCSPTRASCLTGRHPYRYGVTTYNLPLKLQEKTIAQALKAAGYKTGHFGKWHLNAAKDRSKPIAKDDPLNPGVFGFETWFSAHNTFDLDSTFSRGGTAVATKGDGSDVIVAEALTWIDSLRSKGDGQPFFALIWFSGPHVPYDPLPADLQAAGGNGKWGELVGVDRAVGTLRSGLRQRGLADNTMLWFNSDNGPTSGSKPLKEQK